MNAIGKAATGYAARLGWSVFPVAPDGRTPIKNEELELEHGCKDASKDPEVVEVWYTCLPSDTNVSLATGLVSGVLVVDVDMKEGVDGFASLARLEAANAPLPPTWRSATPSGGEHRFFRQPDRPIRNRVGLTVELPSGERDKFHGIDIRADNGSVCLPPSVRPDGSYRWLDHPLKTKLAPLPDWLLQILDPPEPERVPTPPIKFHNPDRMARYVESIVAGECDALARMGPNTGRNLRLFQASANLYSLVGANLLPDSIAQSQLERAASDCGLVREDGWHAIRATIASGRRRGLANPREVRP